MNVGSDLATASWVRTNRIKNQRNRSESGFTLIELLIVILILPLIVGAIAVALVSVFSLQGSTSNRVADASDAQVVSANFENDVHGATEITTNPSTSCGASTQTQLLGLEWGLVGNTYQNVVSYVTVTTGSTTSLVRQICLNGASSSPSSSSTISYDIPAGQSPPAIAPSSVNASGGWVAASSITSVTFVITEPASAFGYTLIAAPGESTAASNLPAVAAPSNSCGLATPGTGTYASKLCFVDFTSYNVAQQESGSCDHMSTAIADTSDTLSFCLAIGSPVAAANGATATSSCASVSSYGPVCPATIPTYSNPTQSSQAFLGDNGFYTGIPGRPALYQTVSGSTTELEFTQIQITDSLGNPVTGWNLVTGDAETTDSSESLTWNMTSGQNLNLLPDNSGNTQAAEIGNACADTNTPPTTPLFPGTWLTGVGTPTVQCEASISSNKTGTVMLEAQNATSAQMALNATMHGAGLQAIFLGVMLP